MMVQLRRVFRQLPGSWSWKHQALTCLNAAYAALRIRPTDQGVLAALAAFHPPEGLCGML